MGIFSFLGRTDNSERITELLAQRALIIDVRTPQEYRAGHITESVNIPLDLIPGKVNDLKRKNKAVITCCQSGSRSGMAASQLRQVGIEVENGGPWYSLQQML